MTVDLDKARAARREARGEGPKVIMGGEEFELAIEMPYEVLEAMRGMGNEVTAGPAMIEMAEALLGAEAYLAFLKMEPSVDDIMALVDGLMSEYGVDAPLTSSGS